jgi:RNA polymerase sigma factor (TIGR02999 family)
MSDVTRILSRAQAGDATAANELLPLVYDELRKLATAKLAQEKPGQTLQATALVHEAYLRLVGGHGNRGQETGDRETRSEVRGQRSEEQAPTSDLRRLTSPTFDSRGHFFAAAAEAMRRILVEQARRKEGPRAGGGYQRVELSHLEPEAPAPDFDIVALHAALGQLETIDPRAAQLIKLRFFVGLTIQEAAEALGISLSTAKADWTYAKNWLRAEMQSAT